MRCRSNCFGQAWPSQAAGPLFAQGSCRRACKANMLSAHPLISCYKSRDSSHGSRALTTLGPFGSSLEKAATNNTHRYATPQRFSPTHFRPPSRRPPSDCPPSVSRRTAGLKMLCIMFYSRERKRESKFVSLQIIWRIFLHAIWRMVQRQLPLT